MVTVQDKLYNIDLIIEDVKLQPQTYNTILKEEVYNPTLQFILRRKINKLSKDGRILKSTIPGTRYGQAIIYFEPRKYKILVENLRTGVAVYYFMDYQQLDKFNIKVIHYWKLQGTEWLEFNEEKIFFEGHTLKFI